MSQLSKQDLKAENQLQFPNNNNGAITPSDLRAFNVDMIDSTVNQTAFDSFSGSVANQFANITSSVTVNTGSLLVTASFDNGTRNLTFTKGDASTFAVNIPDVSGSTGNFATTGSNTFVGDQTISGSVLPLVNGQGDLGTDSQRWNSVNVNGQIKGASVNASGRSSLGTIRLGDETFPLNFLSDREIVGDGTGADTHLYYGTSSVSVTALRELVYTQSGSNADFGAVSASFNSRINNITGSSVNTASFATTGSNTFIGNQNILGGLSVSSSTDPIALSGSSFRVETVGGIVFRPGTDIQFQGNTVFTNPGRFPILNVDNSGSNGYYGFNNEVYGRIYQDFSGSVDARINAITGSGGSVPAGTVSSSVQILNYGIFATTGSNTFTGNQTITTGGNTTLNVISTDPSGQANLEFQAFQSNFRGYGNFQINNNGQFGGSGSVTMLATNNFLALGADNGIRIGATNGGGNGLDSNFASMQVRSGSISLAPAGFSNTTASLAHISSSTAQNNINLIFKNNNNTSSTIVSGSGNIFINVAAPTAGFVRYMTGGNIGVGGSGVAVPQISGSMAFSPTIANNYFGVSANPITLRGPVSSSAYTLNNNVLAGGAINLGTSAANNFERAVSGLSLNANVLAGTLQAVAAKTPLSASSTIASNIIGGGATLNMDSSSINFGGNTVQGGLTVNNSYFPTTYTAASAFFGVNANIFIGANTIYASGSNTTFTGPARSVQNSSMLGTGNVFSASLNGDLAQINSTHLIGQSLIALGTNSRPTAATAADWGSVFVGRWNDITGTKDLTAETIFAVGTGTGEATRKTGF
jgi:hypothetical protein